MEFVTFDHFYTFLFSITLTLIAFFYCEKLSKIGLDTVTEIQKSHIGNSYRLGGIIVLIAIYFGNLNKSGNSFETNLIFLALLPMFLVALVEDLFRKATISARLFTTFISAILIVLITNVHLENINVSIVDFLLSYKIIAVLITALGITITANSWNFIDGLNGVSSGLAIIILIALINLSNKSLMYNLSDFLYFCISAYFGFWLINQFFGRIFMGDAGSYLIGSIIGWAGVKITYENVDISPWVIFFLIIYPAMEFSFSFIRRIIRKKSPAKADNKHLHSLLLRLLIQKFGKNALIIKNSLCGLFVVSLASMPSIYVIFFDEKTKDVIIGIILFLLFYILFYIMLIHILNRKEHL